MKNIIKPILPFSILLMAVNLSCEELLDDMNTGDVREKIEGQWQCDETSEYYKSTATKFTVYISPHPDDSTKVLIDNFYQLGFDVSAVATVSNRNLYINSQTIGDGFEVIGSGTISSNYNQIDWNYSVNDGSGQIDDVVAVYTKL
ncbi:MAG: hypothetical protein JW973_12575 [Bacteroidales bacterium]|nr:hypothetical protein [Bacteroidales bacterium]